MISTAECPKAALAYAAVLDPTPESSVHFVEAIQKRRQRTFS
jgi:hypothetical protein